MNTKMQLQALSLLRPIINNEFAGTGPDWWSDFVLPHISYWNRDRAWRLGHRYDSQMDLAETIRVLMGNWDMISDQYCLDRRYYGVLAHLKHARNGRSHLSTNPDPVWDNYDLAALAVVEHLVKKLKTQSTTQH